jgi:dolichol-phosphate mannosyltransferase
MKALIVLPSYNERENIVELIEALLATGPDHHVTVVDDSSPDGTAQHVQAAIDARPGWPQRVQLIVRAKKDGRGGAVREGFARSQRDGLRYDAYVEMDCDFSHEPAGVPIGLSMIAAGTDVVIGARYPDGTIIGWPMQRRVFSYFANQLARTLIDRSVRDYTNGFRFYSPKAMQVLLKHPQTHKGYIYLSETLSHLLREGCSVGAFPITFKNRERGVSNTTLKEVRSALTGIVSIAWQHRTAR